MLLEELLQAIHHALRSAETERWDYNLTLQTRGTGNNRVQLLD
jgi:hypothetical protein